VRQNWAGSFFKNRGFLPGTNYSALIGNYAQSAIILGIVGQELHDHQASGLPD